VALVSLAIMVIVIRFFELSRGGYRTRLRCAISTGTVGAGISFF
jgi:hypothetical protein